jgi:hypothetical protein
MWRLLPLSRNACLLAALQLLLFAMIATMPKGIWMDEFLQFAFGAFPDSVAAVKLIFATIRSDMNLGQTGFQMVLNHLLLHNFGASYLMLRLPSYLGYSLGILAGSGFLAGLGCSFFVRFAFVVSLGLSQLNLEHGWEARPYILLQGTVLGFLWAWQRFVQGRGGWFVVLAISVLGILFHPFFVAYLGLVVTGTILFFPDYRRSLLALALSRKGVTMASALFVAALFLLVGRIGWFRSLGNSYGLDPYQYVGHDKSLPRFMLGTFFVPFSIVAVPLLGVLLACLAWWRKSFPLLWSQVLLLGLTLLVSQAVITNSVIRSHYWILQRQWVAGNGLALLIAAILVEALWRKLPLKPVLRNALTVGVILVAFLGVGWKLRRNLTAEFSPVVPLVQSSELLAKISAQKEITPSEFQSLAHQNMLLGGPVWPVFQRYYLPEAGRP